jgi:hypothetical protein
MAVEIKGVADVRVIGGYGFERPAAVEFHIHIGDGKYIGDWSILA